MTTVFAAGSLNIKRLDAAFVERLSNVVTSDLDVVIGDADGADTAIQKALADFGATRVTVYCSGPQPRNNVGRWPVRPVLSSAAPGTRAFFTAKDLEMAKVADYGLMVWDSKSTGTLSNTIALAKRGKKTVIFLHKSRRFLNVSGADELNELVGFMSDASRQKAEGKIALSANIAAINGQQLSLSI